MTVWLHEERSSVFPFGASDQPLRIELQSKSSMVRWLPSVGLLETRSQAIRCIRLGTHCRIQDFFFGEDLKLRRHDYSVNVAGGFAAAQLTSDYVVANGIHLPTRRRAYTRGSDRRPIQEMLMVTIDIAEVQFK
jgi:hypothetical protein